MREIKVARTIKLEDKRTCNTDCDFYFNEELCILQKNSPVRIDHSNNNLPARTDYCKKLFK